MFKILTFLNKPYPYSADIWSNIRFHILVSLFIVGFLGYFQPFGIADWVDEHKTLKIAGYGFVCFIAQMATVFCRNLLFESRKMDYRYKLWYEIVWLTAMIIANSIVVFIYSVWIFNEEIYWSTFIHFVGVVLSLGIFPIMASIIIKHHRFLALNLKEAAQIELLITDYHLDPDLHNESDPEICFTSDNERDHLQIKVDSLLYIESLENYTQFYYIDKNNTSNKSTLRGALKRFEAQVSAYPSIVRTHRSFMVNLENVSHITGNAQGYLLGMNIPDISVPVSRNYGPMIKKALAHS